MTFFDNLTRRLNTVSSSRRASIGVVLLFAGLIILGTSVIFRMIAGSMEDRREQLLLQVQRKGTSIEHHYRHFIEDLTAFTAAGLFDAFGNTAGTDERRLIPLKRFYARHQERIAKITVRSRDNTWVSLHKTRDNYYTLEKGKGEKGGIFFSRTPKIVWEKERSHYIEPVRNLRGEVEYCVVVTTSLPSFFAAELSGLYPGPATWLWVMDTDGEIILVVDSERPDRKMTDFSMDKVESILADTREEFQGRLEHTVFFGRSIKALSVHYPVRMGGRVFGLVLTADRTTLYGGLQRATTALCIIFAVILLLSLFIFYRILHQRKLSQQATKEALLLRKSVLDAATLISIIATDTKGRIVVFNTGAERMLGYRADEVLGKRVTDTIHLEPELEALMKHTGHTDPFRAVVERTMGREDDWVCTYVTREGVQISVNQSTTAITGADGSVTGYLGVAQDITERLEHQRRIEESEKRFRHITQSAGDAILSFDSNLIITFWNRGAESIFGYSEEEILGRPILLLVPERQEDDFRKVMRHIKENGRHPFEGTTIERPAKTKDGREIAVEISLASWEVAGERFTSQVIRDISRRKQAEEELQVAKEAAEEANRAKSDFLARMSHEIRTPMNAIIGMSHLLLQTDLAVRQHDYMSKILSSANALLTIINDILDFSKIEAGKMKVESVPFELDDVLCNLSNFTGLKAEEKGLEVLFATGRDVPLTIMGDPLRLGQVLINLLGNAIKFTEKGEIVVRTELEERQERKVTLRFSISDTGIGLTKKETDSLFQAFSQADGSTTRKYGGTGLGLSICSKLVEMMDGTIEVKSKKGVGSTFSFTARFDSTAEVSGKTALPKMEPASPRTLVVDDNATARKILKEALASLSLPVETAASGEKALELLTAASTENPFELAILNLRMPGMDGVETSRRISKNPLLSKIPLLLMVTAHDKEEAAPLARDAGVRGFLLKPVCRSTLLDAVMKCFGKSARTGPSVGRQPVRRPKEMAGIRGARVLLVEDNVINRQVAKKLLTKSNLTVTLAKNGREGVKKALGEEFDLVLMDIQMPEMDGLTATKKIREGGKTELPIIAMTANAMEGDREKSIAAGMNDHITKPIDPNLLYGALLKWIEPQGPLRSLLPEDKKKPEEAGAGEPPIPDLPGINVQKGLMMVGRIPSLYVKMLGRFLENNLQTEYKLNKALGAGDLKTARHIVHTVKGVGGTIGAKELFGSAETLEQAIRKGAKESLPPLVERFTGDLAVVLGGLTVFRKEQQEPTQKESDLPVSPVAVTAVGPLLQELSTLLETDLVKAMGKLDEIGKMIGASPLKEEFDTLRKQMEGFDTDRARKSLGKIASALNIFLEGESQEKRKKP